MATLRSQVAAKPPTAPVPSPAHTATLAFTPAHGQIGAHVQLRGEGYPAGAPVDLVWYTVDASYEVERGTEFLGQHYEESSRVLTTLRADSLGRIAGSIQVPADFGGAHDVRGRVDGREVSQAALTIDVTITMEPTEGPVGTPVEL